MNRHLRIAVTLLAILAVGPLAGGCATFDKFETSVKNFVGAVANTKVNSRDVYIAINVFNGAERSVTNVLRLQPCVTGGSSLCRPLGFAAAVEAPFNSGITARNDLRAFMKANPGTLGDAGLYNTLTSATATLQKIMDQYGIKN